MIAWLYLIQDERILKAYRLREEHIDAPAGGRSLRIGTFVLKVWTQSG